jgi:tRNA modification GTPase
MINKLSGWDDTIVALATAPGISAIAVIRLSGSKSFTIINQLFPSKNLLTKASHTLHVGLIKENDNDIDEVVVALYKGPKSFTGEDTIEISCHGSPFIQQQIIEACLRQGARLAKPGEFTQRAFLNGKMDLTQAEAVADIIISNTKASQQTALHNIRGGFSTELKEMREQLIQFAALIELELDFATEDVEFADRSKFYALVDRLTISTRQLIDSFQLGNVIKNGVSVAIIGKPNAGKSTLLNALLNEERAIVSDIAGTTRDTIEETLNIDGVLFRLIDTAGIREHTADTIEAMGMERSKQNADTADIILHLADMTDEELNIDHPYNDFPWLQQLAGKCITVHTKFDKWQDTLEAKGYSAVPDLRLNPVAAKSGFRIDDLRKQLFEKAIGTSINTESTIVTNARHYEALQQVNQSLHEIKTGLDNNLPGDLLALDIRRCLYWLGEITGEVTNEDKLDYIFSKFCIGK